MIKKLLILLPIYIAVGVNLDCYGQDLWSMQPSVLQTRWAKLVSPKNTLNEYPRPQLARKNWTNLNGLWDYSITSKNDKIPKVFEGKILVPYPIESALSGVKKALLPDKILWYHKEFKKPKIQAGERILLNFGAVDWQATVYVNGKQIGLHSGGYTAFSFDITDVIKEGNNQLMIKVYDPTNEGFNPHGKQTLYPANIYYTPSSGIWQTVWLETVSKEHIESLKMVPNIDKSLLNLKIKLSANVSSQPGISLETSVTVNGKEIFKQAYNDMHRTLSLPIKNARLWSPNDPFLYGLIVRLKKGNKVVDEVKSYFGMRKIDIQKDEKGIDRIFLNNKYTYNLGTLDQGFWPEGLYTAPNDEALAFDIKAIKAMGFNTIRKHIKVEPARWYYHADRLGVLVWQDLVNPNQSLVESAKLQFEAESKEILDQLQNYPCITTWVLFNERWGQYDQERLTKWIKDIDPSRIINAHSGEMLYVDDKLRFPAKKMPYIGSEMTDAHSYPEPRLPMRKDGMAMVCGEFGGIGVSVPSHQWSDLQGWGYVQATPRQLESKYGAMVKKLVELEAQGLSGSIYTEPFDVEGEENGMLTYDREILKISLDKIRRMHSKLVALDSLDSKFTFAKNIDLDDTDDRYFEFVKAFDSGLRDSSFLRRLALVAGRKKDQKNVTMFGNTYVSLLKNPLSDDNIKYINVITRTSKDTGFNLYINNIEKINQSLGSRVAEDKIRNIIRTEELGEILISKVPNWDKIAKSAFDKYGDLGSEAIYGSALTFYWANKNDWQKYGRYFVKYFSTALHRTEYSINSMTWPIFEHVTDQGVLDFAIEVQKYSLDKFPTYDGPDQDTYANLLYKAGRNEEAIKWQEEAVRLSKGENTEILENLAKMKRGEKTWKE